MGIVVVVPSAVVEVVVVVGDLRAVQPVDLVRQIRVAGLTAHHDAGGGVPGGVDGGSAAHHPEGRRVLTDVGVAGARAADAVAHEGVVVADIGGVGIALSFGLEQQPELLAGVHIAGYETPVLGHDAHVHDLDAGRAVRAQRETGRRGVYGDGERLVVLDMTVCKDGDVADVGISAGRNGAGVRTCGEVRARRSRARSGGDGERRLG